MKRSSLKITSPQWWVEDPGPTHNTTGEGQKKEEREEAREKLRDKGIFFFLVFNNLSVLYNIQGRKVF